MSWSRPRAGRRCDPHSKTRSAPASNCGSATPPTPRWTAGAPASLSQRPPGRGITRDGREMVIALPRLDGWTTATDSPRRSRPTPIGCESDGGRRAPPIELLPTQVEHETVAATPGRHRRRSLIGLGERELQPVAVDFAEQPHLLVLGEAECGKTSALRLLCREIVRTNDRRHGADRDRRLSPDAARCRRVRPSRRLRDVARRADVASARCSTRLQARMPGENVTQQQLRTGRGGRAPRSTSSSTTTTWWPARPATR